MISPQAVKEYLNAELDDYDWIKECSFTDLMKEVDHLKHHFKTTPLGAHQLTSFLLTAQLKNFFLLLDMGLGKSWITLNSIQYWINNKEIKRALVVVPNLVNIAGFAAQVEEHSNLTCCCLIGTEKQRTKLFYENDADVYIINYDSLAVLTAELLTKEEVDIYKMSKRDLIAFAQKKNIKVDEDALHVDIRKKVLEEVKEYRKNSNKKEKRSRVIIEEKLKSLCDRVQCVVYDEIQNARNTKSITFKICKAISLNTTHRIGMTGTPIGRKTETVWAQFFLVDLGKTFGAHKNMFLEAFYTKKITNKFNRGIVETSLKKDALELIYKRSKNVSIRYAEDECNELPQRSVMVIPYQMTGDQLKEYIKVRNDVVSEHHDKNKQGDSKRSKTFWYSKARKIVSGFIYVKDEEDDSKNLESVDFIHNPKMELLINKIQEMPYDSKGVIFYIWKNSKTLIEQALKEADIGYINLEGDKDNQFKFAKDKKYRVCLGQITSSSAGLNLQAANYEFFYDLTDRPDEFSQALKRVHRTGQKKRCFIYLLLAKNSVDFKIKGFLDEGKTLHEALMDGKVDSKDII